MMGINQDMFKQLEAEGYRVRWSDDMLDLDKVRVEISKDGNTLGASIPKIDAVHPEEFYQKIESMKAMMELLTEEME